MIIARDKKASNIAEYLIYMFQVEDMIRASKFNISVIEKTVINQYKVNKDEQEEIKNWYVGLIEMMKEEHINEAGHLQFVTNSLADLNEFHFQLLGSGKDTKYSNYYKAALPSIQDFKSRSKSEKTNEIEVCINGLYSLFLLRLQKKEISAETLKSFSTFSEMLAYLASQYKKYEIGKLEL